MQSYTLYAPGKINLYLEIIGDRPDGFHEMAMILQSIGLADQVTIKSIGVDQIRVHCSHPLVPSDASNLAHRAAVLMAKQFPEAAQRYGGVEITIDKQIPVGAGLAGGSTNGAAVLVGLDLMWNLGLTQSELQELGAQLGSDVPFCIAGGTAIATGRGEVLAPLPSLDGLHLVLGKYRDLSISTPWAYKTYRQQFSHSYVSETQGIQGRQQRVHSGPMVAAIAARHPAEIGKLLHNDLEKVALPAHPRITQLKDAFAACHPLGVMMSGSGPTVFAIAQSADHGAEMRAKVQETIADPTLDLWITQSTANGIHVAYPA
jgi:4-diphosphocytidyl-2-C-methyl-D-erythritol kinase